jgi:hypothetical protein
VNDDVYHASPYFFKKGDINLAIAAWIRPLGYMNIVDDYTAQNGQNATRI